jgi:hypothetical protein
MNALSPIDNQFIDGLKFCAFAYDLFEKIASGVDGVSRIRMRNSIVEKKLIEELLPICKYIQAKYRTGRYISVCWKSGNQNHDAEIIQSGAYIDQGYYHQQAFLEITSAVHPKDYLSRELLNKQGFAFSADGLKRQKDGSIKSEPIVHTNYEYIERFSEILLARIKDKASKRYPDHTTLIVCCCLDMLCTSEEWEYLRRCIEKSQQSHQFEEIYIYETTHEFSFSLWGSSSSNNFEYRTETIANNNEYPQP